MRFLLCVLYSLPLGDKARTQQLSGELFQAGLTSRFPRNGLPSSLRRAAVADCKSLKTMKAWLRIFGCLVATTSRTLPWAENRWYKARFRSASKILQVRHIFGMIGHFVDLPSVFKPSPIFCTYRVGEG